MSLLWLIVVIPLAAHGGTILDVSRQIPGQAIRMTPDAATVVGLGFIWTAESGIEHLNGQAVDVSDDGRIVIGTTTGDSGNDEAAIWVNGELEQTLGGLPGHDSVGHLSSGYAVSGDGQTVVGLGWTSDYKARGFRWTEYTGMIELSHIGDVNYETSSRATTISADGTLIGGFDEHALGRRAKLWFDDNTEDLILEDAITNPLGLGEVIGISRRGQWVVGSSWHAPRGQFEPFIWHKGRGVVYLGLPEGVDSRFQYIAAAVSDNGKVVVGTGGDNAYDGKVAWIWTQSRGMTTIKTLLEEACIPWSMDLVQLVVDVSADGRFILAVGGYPFNLKSYLIDLKAVKEAAQHCSAPDSLLSLSE
ncbi:MAG: hypothetical protein GY710_20160 [Desulfobacteraceae bacterium]|nr:hypothetical protein [Desulfobacteraceae bacterium]